MNIDPTPEDSSSVSSPNTETIASPGGLGRRSSPPRPASVDEPATLGSNFDISGSARLIAEAKKKKKKPKSRGQKRKKSSKDAAVLEEDNNQLYRGNSEYVSKLSELEATITQLRQGLDSVKGEAANIEEKFRRLESKRAAEKETLKVAQEKVETRARANEKLKSELDAAIRDNDGLQAKLAASNKVRITLSDMRSELEEKLKKAQFDLKKAYEEIEATEARSTLLVEYEKWKSRKSMLEAAQRGIADIPARIAEAKAIEDKAKKALEDSSEEDPEGSSSNDSGFSSAD
ncbi:uncharacterized protein LOC132624236 [Lycium barbarum]|uniref:uncharacterized protein LOC132624236 n=1 Tax=Lycium barbarum TaxID=112863 RepID=UPI00293F58C2|nr:uncharacterized protein LOC132624236 [Lycium barbarum]